MGRFKLFVAFTILVMAFWSALPNAGPGRSWGCPALRKAISKRVIDTIKDGSLVFVYYPDGKWLKGSVFLAGE